MQNSTFKYYGRLGRRCKETCGGEEKNPTMEVESCCSSSDYTNLPLFESKSGKGRTTYRVFAASIFVGICSIWAYRAIHIPRGCNHKWWAWMGLFAAELWFGFYWILTQGLRWNPVYYTTFSDRLSLRFGNELPCVDIFVCTADPTIEPPSLVMDTILSAMAFDYPQDRLSVYLSDDGGSKFTFYALQEAIEFSKHWIPFCKKHKIEPRCPSVYFSSAPTSEDLLTRKEFDDIKRLYEEMRNRIETLTRLGTIQENLAEKHKVPVEWNTELNPKDHETILQILIDGRDSGSVDIEGSKLPNLIYLAREKRPSHHHNFKAGALNALIRVSSAITNAPIILNLDCDMYSNNSKIMRDALCFFMDGEQGCNIGFVQLPQNFRNLTKNNIYGDSINVVNATEIPGMNAYGGPCYMGTGCFHRRDSIYGKRHLKDSSEQQNLNQKGELHTSDYSTSMLMEKARDFASCRYEENTMWGKEMGVKYGFPVEDIATGISIQCKGWRSVYYNPERKGFLGIAPITLSQMLVQHKRWSEGMFQIFLSRYCPFLIGCGKMKLPLQMAYSTYCLWPPCSLATLCYVLLPPLYLLKGVALFPKIWSPWFVPFTYVTIASYGYSLGEALWSGETLKGWWNMQRTWMMRRVVSYFFGFVDTILGKLGFTNSAFIITAKVAEEDVIGRYENEVMDFGPASAMFKVLATVVVVELLCFVGGLTRAMVVGGDIVEDLFLQFLVCGMMVLISLPIYEALFVRRDKGCMPASVTVESVAFAVAVCALVVAAL